MMFSTFSRKGGAFLFLFSLLSSLLLFSSQSGTALAAPVSGFEILVDRGDKDIPSKEEVERLIKPENLHEFDKFAKDKLPGKDKSVFFTGQDKKNIKKIVEWAAKKELTAIRHMWKNDNFYNRGQYKDVDNDTFKKFQEAFSKYYAQKTEGKARLVFPHDKTPKKTGIFWSVELDEIIQHGKVDEIVWIDQGKIDKDDYKWEEEKKIYWKKGDKKPDGA